MNENIDLSEILKYCVKGTMLYSPLFGDVRFDCIDKNFGCIIVLIPPSTTRSVSFLKDGRYFDEPDGECLLFPSKDQRDWSKFKFPTPKKPKGDPKTWDFWDKILMCSYKFLGDD